MASAFHDGELAVQERAGVSTMAAKIGNVLQPHFTPFTANFFMNQEMVYAGSIDEQGRVWASLLIGQPHFITVLDEQHVQLEATPFAGDPLADHLVPGNYLGLLGIELANRRRVRLNGTIEAHSGDAIQLVTDQVFGNCPKYIQKRELRPVDKRASADAIINRGHQLTDVQREWITSADTFFIASAHPNHGVDVSHRGGQPGCIQVSGDQMLVWPDYSGNMMFNTLGNIVANPQVGLLFVDFDSGNTLQITGKAHIIWDEEQITEHAGAERLVEFKVDAVIEMKAVLPFRGDAPEFSPYNPVQE